MIGDVGISAAQHEQAATEAKETLAAVNLASSYIAFERSAAWKDMQSGLDEQVEQAESSILESEPGETIEMKRDKFVRFQEWKKIRVFLEHRVTEMSSNYRNYAEEMTKHGNDHAQSGRPDTAGPTAGTTTQFSPTAG
jgi:hypothetical protein